jgi:hypothetical protein
MAKHNPTCVTKESKDVVEDKIYHHRHSSPQVRRASKAKIPQHDVEIECTLR